MMRLTCCCSLQKATKEFGELDFGISLFIFGWSIYSLVIKPDPKPESEEGDYETFLYAAIALSVVLLIVTLIPAIFLIRAARVKLEFVLKLWLIIACVGLVLDVILIALSSILLSITGGSNTAILRTALVAFRVAYKPYEMAVVFRFRKEILETPATESVAPTTRDRQVTATQTGQIVISAPTTVPSQTSPGVTANAPTATPQSQPNAQPPPV